MKTPDPFQPKVYFEILEKIPVPSSFDLVWSAVKR